MNKKQLILGILALLLISPLAFAYFENYPPYKFKDGTPKHLEAELLVDLEKPEYKSKEGKIIARLRETSNNTDFLLQDGNIILVRIKGEELVPPHAVYQADVDKNGFKDFIVFFSLRDTMRSDKVEIFLKRKEGSYQKISYETSASGLEDFVDLDNNGKYEVIITDTFNEGKHNYFSYNIYEFKDCRLVNADAKYKSFPKFIWITNKPNDKDTVHLTKEQRVARTKEKDRSIKYGEVK